MHPHSLIAKYIGTSFGEPKPSCRSLTESARPEGESPVVALTCLWAAPRMAAANISMGS